MNCNLAIDNSEYCLHQSLFSVSSPRALPGAISSHSSDSNSGSDAVPQDVCHMECTIFYLCCRGKPYSYACGRDEQYHRGRRDHRCEHQYRCRCGMGCRGGICAGRNQNIPI
ncbi:hypothetical protein V8C26DRAFT_78950 [Trichoderma gracile]